MDPGKWNRLPRKLMPTKPSNGLKVSNNMMIFEMSVNYC